MKRNKKNQNKQNFLDYVPRKKHENWKEEKEQVTLFFEHKGPVEQLVQKLFKKPEVTDITLDKPGSAAWIYIDGSRSVREIGKLMCLSGQQNEKAIYNQLAVFYGYLYRKKWIAFKNCQTTDACSAASDSEA